MDAVTFELPPVRDNTAAKLRYLEDQAPKHIRGPLIQAAQELEAWKALGDEAARTIEECMGTRISQMATHSTVEEIQNRIKRVLSEVARRLREMP